VVRKPRRFSFQALAAENRLDANREHRDCLRRKDSFAHKKVLEAVDGSIKALQRRGPDYRDMNYLLLKAQRLAATQTELLVLQKAAQYAQFPGFLFRAEK
jgi:hypothetical protein